MCLLLVARDIIAGHPLVLLANRDEYYARETEPAALRAGEPWVICGLDKRAGGTWLGLNAHGLAVVLTNRRGTQDAARPSRGAVVRAALAAKTVAEAVAGAVAAAAAGPNPFALFVADAGAATALASDGPGTQPQVQPVGPGLHTLTNLESFDEVPPAEVLRAADGGPTTLTVGLPLIEAEARLRRIALSHKPLASARARTCVHDDANARGTVSSAILAIGSDGHPARFLAADGAPCRHPFRQIQIPR